jgi:hypothetical protein
MKEIPISLIRANQWGIVLLIVLSMIMQQPILIALVLIIQVIGFQFGMKYNIFVQIAQKINTKKANNEETESAELQKFNNAIAVILLTISVLLYLIGFVVASYIFAAMVSSAALLAISGYCIGCKIYYRFKRLKSR